MSTTFVIDTNIFIYLFNERLGEPLPDGDIGCSVITEMELLCFPALDANDTHVIRTMLNDIIVYAIDNNTKEKAIQLRREYRLKLPDAIVAATAIVNHATLITNDRRFQVVQELECLDLRLKR